MTKLEDAQSASAEFLFEISREDAQSDLLISAFKVALSKEHASSPVGVQAAVPSEAPVKLENRRSESCYIDDKDMVAGEVKSAMKDLVVKNCRP